MLGDRRSDPRIIRSGARSTASVEIAHIERLDASSNGDGLSVVFSAEELADAGEGAGRAAALAARLAAKEACLQLFSRDAASEAIGRRDFTVKRDPYGAPHLKCSARARALLDRYRVRALAVSLTRDRTAGSAVVVAETQPVHVPLVGKVMFYLFPVRRGVLLANLRRVFGGRIAEPEIVRLAQAHYAHYVRLIFEFFQFRWLSRVRQSALVRVENEQAVQAAAARGKGVVVVTAHFGNWEVATVATALNHPQYRDRFHIVRRYLWPQWFYEMLNGRLRQAGIGVFEKKGSLDAILARVTAGEVVVFVMDQHAAGREGVEVEFFGEEASVFRSPAIIARATGATVVPASSWREPDGRHVVRFEEALPSIACDDPDAGIRLDTRRYMVEVERLILRHPEQWGMWMHQMWKQRTPVTRSLARRTVTRAISAWRSHP